MRKLVFLITEQNEAPKVIEFITDRSPEWTIEQYGRNRLPLEMELIKEIRCLYLKYNVQLIHCKAHTTFNGVTDSPEYKIWYGNKRADELAVQGSLSNKVS